MRTTLTLDDDLARELKELAYRRGTSFKATVNQTLRIGLAAGGTAAKPRRYRVKPSSLGGTRPGVDLDRTLRLADRLEDEAIAHKIELRK
ncbi:MAG: DUF2191 domain-containing protein [Acidobacteria bacterium]|nr:MAG: DUF2191 domain-containing protein [Acidobacteriota bacterium]